MKKSLLQKPIREVFSGMRFVRVKNDDYASVSADGQVKLIVRFPDGSKGFLLGVQLAEGGPIDGLLSHALMRQYDFAYELGWASTKEYSEEEIRAVTDRVAEKCRVYVDGGLTELRDRRQKWTFGDLDEGLRDRVLRLLGLPGVDPYSDAYRQKTAEDLAGRGEIALTMEEYMAHREFYDGYLELSGTLHRNESANTVTIDFSGRKWFEE